MGKKAVAQIVGILIGLVVWIAVGMAGLLLAISANEPSYRTIGGFVGLIAGVLAWRVVSRSLQNKWCIPVGHG